MESNIDKVIEALKPLAEKLGQGAEFLYRVFYRQTIIEGILQLILPAVVTVALIILSKKWYRFAIDKSEDNNTDSFDRDGWRFVSWFIPLNVLAISLIVSLFLTIDGALKIANPHYYTINRIIESVKTKEVQ